LKRVEISSDLGKCFVHIGESHDNWVKNLSLEKHIFITDKNLFRLYRNVFVDTPTIVIGMGENEKNLDTVEHIYFRLLELEADRSTVITGFGGGNVCDITGFAASTYMRGLRFNFIPTTLLAQVDASIGGKNGVNLSEYKNIIGTFSQPQFVLVDFNLLKTLPQREITCGTAEIVKHALIASSAFFTYLEKKSPELLSLDPLVLEKAVFESIRIKSKIVEADATEKGERRKLNFGHTFGHALEKIYGFPHGEAVCLGMIGAIKISVARGLLSEKDEERILTLFNQLKLPTHLSLNKSVLLETIKKDKKRQGESVHFVLLSGLGKSEVVKLTYEQLEGHIHDLCES
jgi:3-dehydroquinate synthase